ncbi:hypothetical protein EG68_01694 [Paragonimus skrjabini miyazakii]|uniref:Uncharacterized protein n=1 Tax=Paragonimus skrjabini miyazakii TaxID=59628 RepID=A0A8S9Z301_9TREM|nr:hypothetical protein EG68_01694 [Paragonimus skrjabini miyazakii]
MVLTTFILFGSFVLCNAFMVTKAETLQPVHTDNVLIERNESEWSSSVNRGSQWPRTEYDINCSKPMDDSYLEHTVKHELGITKGYADLLNQSTARTPTCKDDETMVVLFTQTARHLVAVTLQLAKQVARFRLYMEEFGIELYKAGIDLNETVTI